MINDTCPLCQRRLDETATIHHLIPTTFKGKETIKLHSICHDMIHRIFSERELTNYYHTIERLLENDDIKKFVIWIKKKPIDFFVKSKDSIQRKKKRRK